MEVVPLSPVESQSISVALGSQQCEINVYQKSTGLFLDLAVNGVAIVTAMLCMNGVGLVRQAYLGFSGQLTFIDTQGSSDPTYDGLGSRYILCYAP